MSAPRANAGGEHVTLGGPHVVHVAPALFGEAGVTGGAERYALELARAMAASTPTTLVTFGREPQRLTDGALAIEVLGPARRIRGQPANPMARGFLKALAPAGVIHCHQQHIVASSLAAAYGRVTGRRVFVSDLGGGGWDVSSYFSTDRWYHGHLHISEYSRRVFGHADDPKARVILGGVDTMTFSPADVPRNKEVVYVGRILPHKGINYLIEALPPGLSLTIAGRVADARYLGDLEALAAGKPVTIVRDLDDAGVVAAYRRAVCVVLPSVYRTMYGTETNVPELLGQTLLEGMACGTPAIATNVASLPEVVADGVSGFLVPPNDPAALRQKLEWLRDRPDEVQRLGRAALERVRARFTWPAVVRRCLRAYAAGADA